MHTSYTTDTASKSQCANAVYGIDFFMPEAKPLKLPRACLTDWNKLVPPMPYLLEELALLCALAGDAAVGLAILLSFDCLLHLSEVAGPRVRDIVDHRYQADPVGRGVDED